MIPGDICFWHSLLAAGPKSISSIKCIYEVHFDVDLNGVGVVLRFERLLFHARLPILLVRQRVRPPPPFTQSNLTSASRTYFSYCPIRYVPAARNAFHT
jgi:hypothetical protein